MARLGSILARARCLALPFAAAVAIQASFAAGREATPCSNVPAGAAVEVPASLPPVIVEAVRREVGTFALPGEPFNPTDVVRPGAKSQRLLFVWHRGRRWVVATERGGRGYSNPVLALDLDAGRAHASRAGSRTAFPKDLCMVATELLD